MSNTMDNEIHATMHVVVTRRLLFSCSYVLIRFSARTTQCDVFTICQESVGVLGKRPDAWLAVKNSAFPYFNATSIYSFDKA